jgi:hypothetical protein
MISRQFQPTACGALIISLCMTTMVSGQDWSWDNQPGRSVALKHNGTVVWQLNHGSDQPKPHFHPVALPNGRVVTWDRPPDHAWHHGLWFSWKYISGLNYWEPDRRTGKHQGSTEWENVKVDTRPDRSARIEMDLTYRPPDAPPVMIEKRVVDVSTPDEQGTYHFDWTSTFTAGAKDVQLDRTPLEGEPGGKPWGGYAGLSVRLAKGLTERQVATTEGPVPFGQQSSYRGKARAMDYSGLVDGQPVGVAICDHPDNLNHPTPWYAICAQPMSYFSPAVICYGSHTLEAGRSLTLRYRVIVHGDRWGAQRLQQEYDRFVREAGKKTAG